MTNKLSRKQPRQWEYKTTQPMLPPNPKSAVMDYPDMNWWLNQMDEEGWEYVGYAQKHWINGTIQDWWIFRRPLHG